MNKMNKEIQVVNVKNGELKIYRDSILMVAPNGMAFIKKGKCVVWCSASTDFVAEEVESAGEAK